VLRSVFVAAQELVSLNLGYHPDAPGLVGFGALDAAQTSNFDRTGKGDFMRQRKQYLHWRTAGDRLWQEEVHPARTYVLDSVVASPIAEPLVQRTIIGSLI